MLSGCAQVTEIRIDTLPDLCLYGCKVCRSTGSQGTVGTVDSVGMKPTVSTVSTVTSNVSGPTLRSQWTILSFCYRFFLLVVPFWYFFLLHRSCSCWFIPFNYFFCVSCSLFAVVSSFRNFEVSQLNFLRWHEPRPFWKFDAGNPTIILREQKQEKQESQETSWCKTDIRDLASL